MHEVDGRPLSEVVMEIRSMAKSGQVDAAIKELDRLVAETHQKRLFGYEKACIQVAKSTPQDGYRVAKDYVAKYPDFSHGLLLLAGTLIRLSRFNEALSVIDRSETETGPTQASRQTRAQVFRAMGRNAEARAITQFDASLPDVNLPSLHTWAALNPPRDEEQLRETLSRFEAAGETKEDLALFEANWFYVHGQLKEAEGLFLAANAAYHDYEPIVVQLADVEWRLGKRRLSQERLARAFELNPASFPAAGMLIRAYLRSFRLISAVRVTVKLMRSQLKLS